MLRTFVANPGLGGFGEKEEATADAFCQIVKELVDNAVDACSTEAVIGDSTTKRRVRVDIKKYNEQDDLLSVTVSDTGSGMNNIADCVGAFHSSKQVASKNNDDDTEPSKRKGNSKKTSSKILKEPKEDHTAGRYGVGLTLCLLHAQRLVPESCAFIQSATRDHTQWNVVLAVVDTEQDRIRCVSRPRLQKASLNESGTSVSVLLPVCVDIWRLDRQSWAPTNAPSYYREGKLRWKLGLGLPSIWLDSNSRCV